MPTPEIPGLPGEITQPDVNHNASRLTSIKRSRLGRAAAISTLALSAASCKAVTFIGGDSIDTQAFYPGADEILEVGDAEAPDPEDIEIYYDWGNLDDSTVYPGAEAEHVLADIQKVNEDPDKIIRNALVAVGTNDSDTRAFFEKDSWTDEDRTSLQAVADEVPDDACLALTTVDAPLTTHETTEANDAIRTIAADRAAEGEPTVVVEWETYTAVPDDQGDDILGSDQIHLRPVDPDAPNEGDQLYSDVDPDAAYRRRLSQWDGYQACEQLHENPPAVGSSPVVVEYRQ